MTKPALIGFTGAHKSGKTTYLNVCREHLKSGRTVHLPSPGSEVNRKFGVKDFRIFEHDLRLALTFQSNMLSTYINYRTDIFNRVAEMAEKNRPIVVLSDRTPLDFMGHLFTYIMRSDDPAVNQGDFKSKVATFIAACRNEYLLYDAIIHCPADMNEIEDDGQREDERNQYGVEVGIGYYKDRWQTNAKKISLHDIAGVESRSKAVISCLEKAIVDKQCKEREGA